MATRISQGMNPRLRAVVARLCERLGPMYTTQAVKLPYLVDVVAKQVIGRTVAGGTYQTWEHGVVTKEVFRFIKHEAQGDALFTVRAHRYSESGKQIALAEGQTGGEVLSPEELEVVDFVADQYGHLPYDELGLLTKRLNTEIPPEAWGSNRTARVDEETFLRLSPSWQALYERIRDSNLDDRSRWSEPITGDLKAHFRQALNA